MTAWTEELTLADQFQLFDVYSVVNANHTLVYVLTFYLEYFLRCQNVSVVVNFSLQICGLF